MRFPHPKPEDLLELTRDSPSPLRTQTLLHLLGCPRCRKLVESVLTSIDDAEEPELEVPELSGEDDGFQDFMEQIFSAERRSKARFEAGRIGVKPLYDALLNLDPDDRLRAIEADDSPYRSTPLADHLLDAAEASEHPHRALHLAGLAAAILSGEDQIAESGSSLIVQLRARSHVYMAEAHRRCGRIDTANDLLTTAAGWLQDERLDIPVRGVFCRIRALVRHDEHLVDEALALLERASEIFETTGDYPQLAKTHCLIGHVLEAEFFPSEAYQAYFEAYKLLDPEQYLTNPGPKKLHAPEAESPWSSSPADPSLILNVLDGLLRVSGELDFEPRISTPSLLTTLDRLAEVFSYDPTDLEWVLAKADWHRQEEGKAIARLLLLFRSYLDRAQGVEAATTVLQLARWYLERGDRGPDRIDVKALSLLRRGLDRLPDESLHPALKEVVLFALDCPTILEMKGCYIEALSQALEWIQRARFNPHLPYYPTPVPDQLVPWNEFNYEDQRRIADRFGVELLPDGMPSSPGQARLLAWAQEVLTSTRFIFPETVSRSQDHFVIPLEPFEDPQETDDESTHPEPPPPDQTS